MPQERIWNEDDSIELKAVWFLKHNRVKIEYVSDEELFASVEGLHSVTEYANLPNFQVDRPTPYTVIIKRNGSFSCDCPTFGFAKKESHAFWTDTIIPITPECSHVLAVKHHPNYRLWIDPATDVTQHPLYMKSYIRNTRVKETPIDVTDLEVKPRRRKVNFTKLIEARGNPDPQGDA